MTQDPKGSELRMSLRLSTLFAKEGAHGAPVRRTGGTS